MRSKLEAKRRLKKKRSREESKSSEVSDAKKQHSSSGSGSVATESHRPVDISFTHGSANAASKSVSIKEQDSKVFKKLFHSDKDANKTSKRDLMMSTAGFRYGLA